MYSGLLSQISCRISNIDIFLYILFLYVSKSIIHIQCIHLYFKYKSYIFLYFIFIFSCCYEYPIFDSTIVTNHCLSCSICMVVIVCQQNPSSCCNHLVFSCKSFPICLWHHPLDAEKLQIQVYCKQKVDVQLLLSKIKIISAMITRLVQFLIQHNTCVNHTIPADF